MLGILFDTLASLAITRKSRWHTFIGCLITAVVLAASLEVSGQAPPMVEYEVRFEAIWSEETHPEEFPPVPHFSQMLIATHSDEVEFWREGGIASPGMETMAEIGSSSPFSQEVAAAIDTGTADGSHTGTTFSSPGTDVVVVPMVQDFPRITVVSMVAPSPDWFVGVSGLELFDGVSWEDQIVLELWTYDAGTDSGTTYLAPNDDTEPQQPITLLTSGPIASGEWVGTLTFSRFFVDPNFIRGDCQQNGTIELADVVVFLTYLFTVGSSPQCLGACDADGDGALVIVDALYLLAFLFQGGPAPVEPFPLCGAVSNPSLACAVAWCSSP